MKRSKIIILFVIFLGWITSSLSAQGLVDIQHYSINDGLSQSTAQNIIQDDEGYIWLSTWNGLEKFDGYSFRNYKSYPTDEIRLQNNRLIQLAKGYNHTLWCQTYDNKIYLFDIRKERFDDIFAYHPDVKECELIEKLVPLDNGVLWIIGDNGCLWRIDGKKYKEKGNVAFFPPASIPEHGTQIYTITLDQHGNEWVLTDKGYRVFNQSGLSGQKDYRFTAGTGRFFFLANIQGEIAVYTPDSGIQKIEIPYPTAGLCELYALQNGKLVIATRNGFIIYDHQNRHSELIPTKEEYGNIRPNHLFEAKNGILWMFEGKQRVIRCDIAAKEMTFIHYPERTNDENISFIHEDENGHIWILPLSGELTWYNPETKCLEQAYSYDKGKKIDYKAAGKNFLIDTHKNLWLCCLNSGFDKLTFSNGSYSYISTTNDVEVRGLFIDSKQRMWAANKNGKIEIYNSEHNTYIGNLSASGNVSMDKRAVFGVNIYCFYEDKQHRIWMGSRENGLYIAIPQGERFRIVHFQNLPGDTNSINNNSIYSICEDWHGRIWIGTHGGGINLVEGDLPNLHFIHKDNRLTGYPRQYCLKVRNICCTSGGVMLVGTTDGLLTFSDHFRDVGDIRFYHNYCDKNRPESLSNNDIMYVFESSSHKYYIASYSGGISCVESDDLLSEQIEFSHLNKKNGLPSDMACGIVEGKNGDLWIAFENCVCRYNPEKQVFETYNRFNFHSRLRITEAPPVINRQNEMYAGTNAGALHLDLNRLKKSSFIPPIVFTGVNIRKNDGSSLNITSVPEQKLTLKKDERNVTVLFSALDFTNNEMLEYAYRLKGLSEEWIYAGKNRSAGFVNLPAGTFVLEVKSTNGDGVWVNNVTGLVLHVKPIFWETGWAGLVYISLIIFSVFAVSGILVYIFNLRRKIDFEQQLTDLKLRFFTDISHELRTPLTLIASPIEEIIERETLSREGRENMIVAKKNTDRMLKLINQLLDFRKIQNKKMKLYIEQIDVVVLFKCIFENFTNLAHQRNIRFQLNCAVERLIIYTDADKLEKILFNLLSNAFKYTPNGKSIDLNVNFEGNRLNFSVKDEGKGFDLRKVDALFKRFETLNYTDTMSSGIGLSLVKDFVGLLHGTISTDSVSGQGSIFEVSIPGEYEVFKTDKNAEFILDDGKELQEEDPKAYVAEENTSPSFKDIRLLIIEDNEELRHFMVNILQKDYLVAEAENGKAGLDLILSDIPDLIISDVMMPQMDGIELLEAIRKDRNISHIPVILLSAKSSLDDRIKGLEYGADDYITKPFSSNYLKAKIQSLLKQRAGLREYFVPKQKTIQKQSLKNLSPSTPQITHFDEEFTCRIIRFVEDNLQNPDFKIEDLADIMRLSRTVFYRKAKSILGVSPIDFVKEMRVKRAIQLLDSGNYNVSEIAYMSGFSSPQYFSRVFKEITNQTPKEYKAKESVL